MICGHLILVLTAVILSKDYRPYGEVLSSQGQGTTSYGFAGEWTDYYIKLQYLRSRWYSTGQGRFISRDTWQGDYNTPMSYNLWLYSYANPINLVDPSGLFATIAGIEVSDSFSEEEKALIVETISDYANLLGGEAVIENNLALVEISQGWTNNSPAYNANYDFINKKITLPFGWYSPAIVQAPNGQTLIILNSPCIEDILGFPEGSLPTDEIGAKFVLAHEMTHALGFGNPDTFRSFKDNVDLPWSILAGFSSNPLIKRNYRRSIAEEVFADVIPALIYSQALLNQQMSEWVTAKMPDTLK